MKKLVALVLAVMMTVSCAFALTSCGGDAEVSRTVTVTDKTIKLGLIAPLSGPVAVYGTAVKDGAMLAIKQANANNTIPGYTIDVQILDDLGDATTGAAHFKTLEGSGIAALVGPVTTGVTMAVTSLANEYGVVMMTPSATGDAITTESDFVYRSCFKDSFQGTLAADYAAEKGYTKVAVVYAKGDTYSSGLYEAFAAECRAKGVTITTVQTSQTIADETNFDVQINAIVDALGTDEDAFLFAPYYYEAVGTLIVPTARDAGFKGVIMGSDGYDGMMDYTSGDLTRYNNVMFTNHYDPDAAAAADFIAAFQAEYEGATPNAFAALAYDGANMLINALKDALKTDEDGNVTICGLDVKAAMDANGAKNYTGVTGTFTLDETGSPKKTAVYVSYCTEGEGDDVVLGMKVVK